VAVYTQLPWYWQWTLLAIIMCMVLGLAWATFLAGRSVAFRPFDPTVDSRETAEQALVRIRRENTELRSRLASLEQKIQIDQAAHDNLSQQLKVISEQNAGLKEELAFFQAIGGDTAGVSVQRFTVKRQGAPGELRYRLLVVQSRQRAQFFRGRVEFVVNVVDKGVEKALVFPKPGDKSQSYQLGFKFFQRLEGVLKVPTEAQVTRVEARVFEAGTEAPQATHQASMI
jgi:hypothetical protein